MKFNRVEIIYLDGEKEAFDKVCNLAIGNGVMELIVKATRDRFDVECVVLGNLKRYTVQDVGDPSSPVIEKPGAGIIHRAN